MKRLQSQIVVVINLFVLCTRCTLERFSKVVQFRRSLKLPSTIENIKALKCPIGVLVLDHAAIILAFPSEAWTHSYQFLKK